MPLGIPKAMEEEHQVLHRAGVDLTDTMEQAPHGADILGKFPVIGTLQTKDATRAQSGSVFEIQHDLG